MERLDKLICSQSEITRTQAGRMIRAGRVLVNGQACRRPETKVDPERDAVTVEGRPLTYRRFVYWMLNKPAGILCVSRDPNRQTVVDLLPPEEKHRQLFPAGRLDRDTVGLVILTNDGEYAHRLLAPRSGVRKLYRVRLDGPLLPEHVQAFADGIELADGTKCLPAALKIMENTPVSLAEVEIAEGKYHQIKRMFGTLGLGVTWLKRCRIGALELDPALKEGECRPLEPAEIDLSLQNGALFL